MKLNQRMLIFLSLVGFEASAQTSSPVVDLNQKGVANDSAATAESARADMLHRSNQYYHSQVLQEEVKTLRGTLEEINYQLQQIKQRQLDDYLDIDRRLTAIATRHLSSDDGSTDDNSYPQVSAVNMQAINGNGKGLIPDAGVVKADYDQASGLLLKNKDLEGAIAGFKKHIEKYPNSPFAANAHYWLGEIYDLRDQAELALQSFHIVVDNYGSHSKAIDAQFKLGKLYHKLGQTNLARQLLQAAANSEGGAAAKAKAYLKNNAL